MGKITDKIADKIGETYTNFSKLHALASSGERGAKKAAMEARKLTNKLTALCKEYRAESVAENK